MNPSYNSEEFFSPQAADDFDGPIEQYMWPPEIANTPALIYGETLPPPPVRRRGTFEARRLNSMMGLRRGSRHQFASIEDTTSDAGNSDAAQNQGQSACASRDQAYEAYKQPHLPVQRNNFQRAASIAAASLPPVAPKDYWRAESLPQGVPLILGPNGQWRLYNANERKVIFDDHRNNWFCRGGGPTTPCECATGRRCPHHDRRPIAVAEWSDEEYEEPPSAYIPISRKHLSIADAQARRVFREDAGVPLGKPAPRLYEPGSHAWLAENHGYRY